MKRAPLRPEGAPRITDEYRDWRDFTDRVARPLVESDGDNPRADAYYRALMLGRDPYYLAAALVMADNRLREYEAAETAPEEES